MFDAGFVFDYATVTFARGKDTNLQTARVQWDLNHLCQKVWTNLHRLCYNLTEHRSDNTELS